MSTSAIDWSTLTTDSTTAAAVNALGALAAGFDTGVPAVLMPVRVETRFTTAEVPDVADHLGDLIDSLSKLHAVLERLRGRQYATALVGNVREKAIIKATVEEPLYKATDTDLAAVGAQLEAMQEQLEQPILTGTAEQQKQLAKIVPAVREGFTAARTTIASLRSDFQREQYTAQLDALDSATAAVLKAIDGRVTPAITFIGQLGLRTGAQAARELGRTPAGRPLRPEVLTRRDAAAPAVRAGASPQLPGAARATSTPVRRIVIDDGTAAAALGAERVVRVERSQLVASAEAAELIAGRLADPMAALDTDLHAAAAGITVLPGAVKVDLLAKLDAAAGRKGAAELRVEIEATPSDRADLDKKVPKRPAGTVFTVAGATTTVHQLLIRVYPESLAVDTHEEELTETERSDGTAFWAETAAASTEELRKGAWRGLCIGRSTHRAAWIARVTAPVDPADTAPTAGALAATAIDGALTVLETRLAELDSDTTPTREGPIRIERPPGPLRPVVPRPAKTLTARQLAAVAKALQSLESSIEGAAAALPEAPIGTITARLQTQMAVVEGLPAVFSNMPPDWLRQLGRLAERVPRIPIEPVPTPTSPDVGTRTGTWTRAASSTVLPDRFAVFTVTDGKAGKVAAGKPIPVDLKLGFDPGGDTFSLDDDGNLVVPDSIHWMTDFDEAEAKGMALRLTISAQEAARGFDELLVLGLSGGDAADGESRLTAMLDAHHYTAQGLSLLPIGTPTNNTEDDLAGLSTTDDPDRAYPIERGASLATSTPDSDGRRLATALGVDVDVVAHVAGADGTDAQDSLLTNRALYPGTIGHALEELTSGLISRDARDRLRAYALGDVSARGLLPAIRVDDQPYALLPAVALSRFRTDVRDAGASGAAAKQQRFDDTLLALFRQLHDDWSDLRIGAEGRPGVKHAHSREVGQPGFDAQQHFLGMLGLESSSVESSYRFSVNVADRGGVRGQPDLGLGFGIPPADGSAASTTAEFGPFALMEHLESVLRIALQLPPASRPRDPVTRLLSDDWDPVLEQLTTSRAYGLRLLNGLWPLHGAVSAAPVAATPGTGTSILNLLTQTLSDLRARTEEDLHNVGLAELLVRHALLAEARRAAADILVSRGMLSEEALANLGTSSLYQTWSGGTISRTSAWGLLFTRVNRLAELADAAVPVPVDLDNRFMADVVASPRPAVTTEHRTAITAFAGLPADRMTALTREHLDLCSYRLDAWIGGLAHRRLRALRTAKPRGAQVGAYGWVENLTPSPTAPAATGVPAALAGLSGKPLMPDPSGEGFIQTPSPTHAVTAAILRAAYRSQTAEGSFGNEMSVNLSSDRVRVALSLIDGVRAGNDLGALLGYRLERYLHEYYARPDTPHVVELDSTIFPLRRAYPTIAAVDPAAAAVTEPTRFVVDGLALVRTILDWIETNDPAAEGTLFQTLSLHPGAYPWGTKPGALPPRTDTDKLIGVFRGIDSIADALDALGDLTTSETVHQLVRGNHARAAAVLAALSEGTAIPHPEVTDTPRTGLPVSHKLILQLPTFPAEPVTGPVGWDAVPMTPRASLEPSVNHWLGGLLGDPALIRVRLNADGMAPGSALPEVSLAAFGLQPLDLVAMLADGFDSAVGALTARVLDTRRPADLPPDQPGVVLADGPQTTETDGWRIESLRASAWGPGIRSITDVAPLLEAAADLLGTAKAANASDYAAPEFTAIAGDGIDVDDLRVRVQRLLDGATADALRLAQLLAEAGAPDPAVLDGDPAVWLGAVRVRVPGDPAAEHPSAWLPTFELTTGTPTELAERLARLDAFWSGRDAWRTAAAAAQAYGIRVGLPRRYLSRTQVSTELLQSAEVAFLDLAARCRTASVTIAATPDPKPANVWLQAAKDLLGDRLTVVPKVGLDPVRAGLQTALDADLVRADDLDGWLEGAAAVRRGAADLADVQVLTEALGAGSLDGAVAQLPHVDGDPWLGGALADPTELTGKVSVVIYGAGDLPAVGATGTALLVDEWSETVPYRDEITGVALHYDQPDATAPQAILLAVPPVRDQAWTLTDFAATLHDTLELARNRMVESEHIGASRYGQLLPLLVGEVVPHAAGTADVGDRVILDFHQNNP
ncbi:hypothetical protein QNO00_16815 [Arthrobacter sp. zg-Y1219]|uniref:hypothetical protein n=1 Tax=Arthrobacter sp. zg-Y1219 TaxID=3049067 RepID=UPI0024C373ED|nr:hypothetical protein [Arthrobacter sp. zg-Y1219]MDK1361915.1 hypothetical protein [Arthrobacter sp. zg-Y1219]